MKISHITKQTTLLESLSVNADALTKRNLKRMNENFVIPCNKFLAEVELTADQINQIFTGAETQASAGGDNRTMLGKGKDAAMKQFNDIKAKFEKSLPPPDAGPVEGFDQKAAQAAEQIQDPQAKQTAMQLIQQGLKNPAVQQLILAGVSGAAGVMAGQVGSKIGGALGGAVTGGLVGGLLGVVATKLQGGSWKDAGKAGLKGAAMGAAGGAIGNLAAQGISAGIDALSGNNQPGQMQLPAADAEANRAADENAANQWAAGTPEERAQIEKITGMTPQQLQSKIGDFDAGTGQGWDASSTNRNVVQPGTPSDGSYQQVAPLGPDGQPMRQMPMDTGDFTQAEVNAPIPVSKDVQQLASQEAAKYGRTTPSIDDMRAAQVIAKGRGIRENIDRDLTIRMWALNESMGKPRGGVQLTEAGIGDMFGKAADWAKTKGHNLTTKVTADKLQQAWKKAGSPTDSQQVFAVLQSAGVDGTEIFKSMGIPLTNTDELGRTEPGMDPASSDAAVWKNNRNLDAPAGTSPADAAAKAGQGAAAEPAAAPIAPASAGPDKFVQQLIAAYKALTPEEQAELRKEAEAAYDTASNNNIVKGTNESLRKQFKKLTNEGIQGWLDSKAGRSSSKRLREAAIYELTKRGAK